MCSFCYQWYPTNKKQKWILIVQITVSQKFLLLYNKINANESSILKTFNVSILNFQNIVIII